MMKKFLFLLIILIGTSFADEGSKNPWYMEFHGNKAFSKFQIEEQIDIPDEFGQLDTTKQDFLMSLSIENLRALYYSRGYYSLNLKMDVRKKAVTQDSLLRGYILYINEGERYKFGGMTIIVESDSASVKREVLKTTSDEYYTQDDIANNMQVIVDKYRKDGFLHAQASSIELLDTTNKKIYVEFHVKPGAKVVMGNIRSRSTRVQDRNFKDDDSKDGLTDTAWLSSLWRIPKNETIDGKQYSSFKNKLFSAQIFTQIHLDDSLRADGLSDVHLDVTERIPGEARYGFFFEEIYGFGAQAYARHKNFFGRFNEFSTSFQIAQHKQEVAAGYANPLLFGTSFTFIPTAIRFEDRLSFNHEKINPPAYPDSIEDRYEVINRADLTFGITQNIRFRGTFDTRYVNKNLGTIDSIAIDTNSTDEGLIFDTSSTNKRETLFKLKAEIALTFDYTDDYFNPTKGIRIAPTAGVGINLNGGLGSPRMIGNPYTYGETTVNLYFPIFWTFYGALSGSCGKFFNKTIEDDARVFYQGGSRSVRGYDFRSIYASYTEEKIEKKYDDEGNTTLDTVSIINTGLTPIYLRVNQEIRWTIPVKNLRQWQVVQFFDWAKVMDHDKDVYKEQSDASFGFGLRYRWQFLTFRLDYAFKQKFSDWSFNEPFKLKKFDFDLSQTF